MKLPQELNFDGLVTLGNATDLQWRASYRTCPYMRDMADADLRQRLRDVFRNFMALTREGKVGPLPARHPSHPFWRVRLVHVLEEIAMRFGPYPNGIGIEDGCEAFFPNPNSKLVQAATRAVENWEELNKRPVLVKYGKKEHIEAALNEGVLRISPAAKFADTMHGKAIRDRELEQNYWMFEPTAEDLAQYAHLPGYESFSPGSTAILTRYTLNYYTFCASSVYDPSVFDDFIEDKYDACLIIEEPVAFRDRLLQVVHQKLDTLTYDFRPITYVDPITHLEKTVPIAFQKDAKYMYQQEWRGVWMPRDRATTLGVEYVKLGSLRGVARMVSI